MPWRNGHAPRDKSEVQRPRIRHLWARLVVIGNLVGGIVNTLAALSLGMSRLESRLVNLDAKLEAVNSILKDVPIPGRDDQAEGKP